MQTQLVNESFEGAEKDLVKCSYIYISLHFVCCGWCWTRM